MHRGLTVGAKFIRAGCLCVVVSKEEFDKDWPAEIDRKIEEHTFFKCIARTTKKHYEMELGKVYQVNDKCGFDGDIKPIACEKHSANITVENWINFI